MMCIQEAITMIYERKRKRSKHMSVFCERENAKMKINVQEMNDAP